MQGKRAHPFYQAQAILSRRDHSTTEVKTKLRRKGFPTAVINSTIARLQQLGLLDDERFAAAFTDAALRRSPVGPRWLEYRLRQKGIAPSAISRLLDATYSRGQELELARRAAATWRRSHPTNAGDNARLYRFLISRGFTADTISAIITPDER